jgi:hypothetical protein
MIDFLNTGDDERVRYIKSWVKATERRGREAEDGVGTAASS